MRIVIPGIAMKRIGFESRTTIHWQSLSTLTLVLSVVCVAAMNRNPPANETPEGTHEPAA